MERMVERKRHTKERVDRLRVKKCLHAGEQKIVAKINGDSGNGT